MTTIITGHEEEMATIAEQEQSAELRAITIKMAGERMAENGEILRLAALGQLQPSEDVFGVAWSVEQQVEEANRRIMRDMEIIAEAAAK